MLMLSDFPIYTVIIGGILVFFVLLFVIRFLIPAIYQNWKLGHYTKKVEGPLTQRPFGTVLAVTL